MPQNKFALVRYQLIDCLLHQQQFVKTSFMVDYCFEKTGYRVSQRTIQKDIDSMKYDSFLGIFAPIEYNSFHKAYYYTDPDYIMSPFFAIKEEIQRLELLLDYYRLLIAAHHYEELMDIIKKIKCTNSI